jgi:hypothetical protein
VQDFNRFHYDLLLSESESYQIRECQNSARMIAPGKSKKLNFVNVAKTVLARFGEELHGTLLRMSLFPMTHDSTEH